MKNTFIAAAGLALVLALTSCAPAPTEPEAQTVKQPAAPATSSPVPEGTETAAPVEPTAEPAPEIATTLAITEVEPMPFAATLDPPTLDDIFEIRDAEHGYPAETAAGPRFLLTHATSPGRAPSPGNLWQELAVGDRIETLGASWRIDSRVEEPKSWLTNDPALVERTFGAGPGTLVLVTCVPRWEGTASHNLIFTATKEAS